uniref:Uncharacterized protein n=1 Tax=Arundo donax TaxID=35708 RepID=A0A0A8XN74_ARUDO
MISFWVLLLCSIWAVWYGACRSVCMDGWTWWRWAPSWSRKSEVLALTGLCCYYSSVQRIKVIDELFCSYSGIDTVSA